MTPTVTFLSVFCWWMSTWTPPLGASHNWKGWRVKRSETRWPNQKPIIIQRRALSRCLGSFTALIFSKSAKVKILISRSCGLWEKPVTDLLMGSTFSPLRLASSDKLLEVVANRPAWLALNYVSSSTQRIKRSTNGAVKFAKWRGIFGETTRSKSR